MVLRSVASRLALAVLLGSAIVLIVTGGLLLTHTREQTLRQTEREAAAIASSAANRIQARIDGVAKVDQVLHRGSTSTGPDPIIRDILAANP